MAEVGGTLVGGIGTWRGRGRKSRHSAELGMWLRPEWRGQGIGTQLLQRVIDRAGANGVTLLTLEGFEDNVAARPLPQVRLQP